MEDVDYHSVIHATRRNVSNTVSRQNSSRLTNKSRDGMSTKSSLPSAWECDPIVPKEIVFEFEDDTPSMFRSRMKSIRRRYKIFPQPKVQECNCEKHLEKLEYTVNALMDLQRNFQELSYQYSILQKERDELLIQTPLKQDNQNACKRLTNLNTLLDKQVEDILEQHKTKVQILTSQIEQKNETIGQLRSQLKSLNIPDNSVCFPAESQQLPCSVLQERIKAANEQTIRIGKNENEFLVSCHEAETRLINLRKLTNK